MTRESLIEGIFRSLKDNARWATIIIGLSIIGSIYLNTYFPTEFESEVLLRVMTSESQNSSQISASMQAVLAQRNNVAEIATKSGLSEAELRRSDFVKLSNEGSGLVRMAVRHHNPHVLKDLGEAVIEVLSDHFLGYSSDAQDFEINHTKTRLAHLEKSIEEARLEYKSVKMQVNEELVNLENDTHQLEELIDANRRKLQTIPVESFYYAEEKSPEYQKLNSDLEKERNNLAELFKNYRDKHPRVIASKNRISAIENSLKNAITKVKRKKSNPEYTALQHTINSQRESLISIKTKLLAKRQSENDVSTQTVPANTLALRIKTLEELQQKTLMELEEIRIAQNTTTGRISVLKKDATQPKTVGFSSLQRDGIALVSGFLMAIFLLYSPSPIKAELVGVSTEMLAGISGHSSRLMLEAEPAEIILKAPSLTFEPLALPAPTGNEDSTLIYDERLISLNAPELTALSPFKNLVSNLQISIAESQTRIVLVSSARSKTGRTTLLANTAVLLAQAGYSVLMVDADYRNPSLHRTFDLENQKGLSDALKGSKLKSLIQQTCVEKLSLLATGMIISNPAEAFGSPEMIELVAKLKRKYELILIDTPALLEYPESGILAGQMGAMVFVSPENEPEEDLRASRKLLKTVRAKTFGYVKI